MFPSLSPWGILCTVRKLLATTCGLQLLLLLLKSVTGTTYLGPRGTIHVCASHVRTHTHNMYTFYQRGQLVLSCSAYKEHFGLQLCIVPSMNYWSQRDTTDHYTQLSLNLAQRTTCNCTPNLCLSNISLPEKLSALGTFWLQCTTFLLSFI